jgi:hypothetical protein
LVRFDGQGIKSWEYEPADGVGRIYGCYALNVSDEGTWAFCDCDSDFPLVRIGPDGDVRAWRTEVSGNAFAIDGHHGLFYAGPLVLIGLSARCLLGEVQDDVIATMVQCRLLLPSGQPLDAGQVIGRGPKLYRDC